MYGGRDRASAVDANELSTDYALLSRMRAGRQREPAFSENQSASPSFAKCVAVSPYSHELRGERTDYTEILAQFFWLNLWLSQARGP